MKAGYGTKNLQSLAEELQLPNEEIFPITVQRHCFELFPKQGEQERGSPNYQGARPSTGGFSQTLKHMGREKP